MRTGHFSQAEHATFMRTRVMPLAREAMLLLLRVLQIGIGVGLVGVGLRVGFRLVGLGLRDRAFLSAFDCSFAAFLSAWVTGAAAGSLACANATDDRQPAINAAQIRVLRGLVMLMRYLLQTYDASDHLKVAFNRRAA